MQRILAGIDTNSDDGGVRLRHGLVLLLLPHTSMLARRAGARPVHPIRGPRIAIGTGACSFSRSSDVGSRPSRASRFHAARLEQIPGVGPIVATALHHRRVRGCVGRSLKKSWSYIRPFITLWLAPSRPLSLFQRLSDELFAVTDAHLQAVPTICLTPDSPVNSKVVSWRTSRLSVTANLIVAPSGIDRKNSTGSFLYIAVLPSAESIHGCRTIA